MLRFARSRRGRPWLARLVMTLAAWAVAFLIATALLTLFGDELASLPLALRALVISGVLVAVMANLVMPALSTAIAPWMSGNQQPQVAASIKPDDQMFAEQTADYVASDALLLGRRTYEIFAASWPHRGSDVPNAHWMNNTRKYVASTSLEWPEWQNTTVLEGAVGEAVSRLKQEDGETITLNGSAGLLRSLLRAELVDELRLLLHPVVLGSGQRLFDNGEALGALELSDCHAYDNGVVSITYLPTGRQIAE